ncbi:hypothetical protein C5B96_11080, partial [Subtercola sp. Z020]|uniref:hypothetical protein n=1 Tax=Subtercola sp. Z020 TaxID=2080582 RepID=UPI000D465538
IGREEHSEAVTVPSFDVAGRQVEAKMTLDAGSELVVVPVQLRIEGAFDDDAVNRALADLRTRIDRRVKSNTATYADPDQEGFHLDIDDIV